MGDGRTGPDAEHALGRGALPPRRAGTALGAAAAGAGAVFATRRRRATSG
ncbi:hypothetical protein ABZ023_17675 [Streptomyces sp. NPDC006367]